MRKYSRIFRANSLDAYNPEIWSKLGVAILVENMIMPNLVHTEFKPDIAKFGDTVNTRQPGNFVAARKQANTAISLQDSSATNIPILLNHHVYNSFAIADIEAGYSINNLLEEFLEPAAIAMARYVDKALLAQTYNFLGNSVGTLGTMSSSNAKDRIIDANTKLNDNKAMEDARRLVLGSAAQGTVLKNSEFINTQYTADGGNSFRTANLGHRLGFDIFMGQNTPNVATGSTTGTGAVNNASGYAAGATAMTVDGSGSTTTNIAIGSWFAINGHPHQVATVTGSPTVTAVTFTPALRAAVADNDVITWYTPSTTNTGSTLAAGYSGDVTVTAFSVAPKVGQGLTLGTYGSQPYMVTAATTTSVTLDRPLDAAVANGAVVGLLPAGSYNPAFHRNAIAMVSRVLPDVPAGAGARSYVSSYNGIGMRATIGYSITDMKTIVTLDMLMGVKTLDTNLGAVLLA